MHSQQCAEATHHTPCIFEYVYFARPDSIIDNISVYKARLRMGELLAEKIRRERPEHDIDVVIPVPDTSRTSALQVAQLLGVKYREGFIKNRYIGRTFIMPGQEQRAKSVRSKLNAIDLEFRGRNVLLVDDSIVRGTTSAQIIEVAREAGAKNVYFASAAPPVRHPNVYGIDMPAASELVAAGRTEEEVARIIGADWLIYQDLDDLVRAVRHHDARVTEFDTSCFSGEYVTGDITPEYLARLQAERSDQAKAQRSSTESRPAQGRRGALSVCAALRRGRLLDGQGAHRQRPRRTTGSCSRTTSRSSGATRCRPSTNRRRAAACRRRSAGRSTTSCCSTTRCRRARGLEWLEDLTERAGFPPIVYFAPQGDDARRAGVRRRRGPVAARVRSRANSPLRCARRWRSGATCWRTPRAPRSSRRRPIASGRCASAATAACAGSPSAAPRASSSRSTLRTGQQRVLKIFRQVPDVVEGSTTFDRFLREYDLVSRTCEHPNIARIYDLGVADDHVYIAMEYFPGRRPAFAHARRRCPGRGARVTCGRWPRRSARCTRSACCTGT